MSDLLDTFMEIELIEEDDFLKIKETLTRIGISTRKDGEQRLFQTCHILHKRGSYYLTHFKEMFALDGKYSTFDEDDLKRRNTIAKLLEEWGLCDITDTSKTIPYFETVGEARLRIVKHSDISSWKLLSKYTMGNDSE